MALFDKALITGNEADGGNFFKIGRRGKPQAFAGTGLPARGLTKIRHPPLVFFRENADNSTGGCLNFRKSRSTFFSGSCSKTEVSKQLYI
jgi:hypothetical protein